MAPDLNWELRLGFLVHDVSRLRRRVVDRTLKPFGVTRSQWWVLAFLSRSDGMSQVALADELDLGKVALGQLIDRLEKTGFVSRRPDEEDRRVKRVYLTKRSHALIAQIRENVSVTEKEILEKIEPADLEGDGPCASRHERKPSCDDRRERGRRGFRRGLRPVGQRNSTSLRSSTRTERSSARPRNRKPAGVSNISIRIVSPGKAGAAKRVVIAAIAPGRRGANRLRTARQARPNVLRPCEIGRSKPAWRAISGSA